ncbi:GxxExxY protein [Paramagnetospirillum marisnigri]|uniref:GxxExxY protein n=1 Tax=Paramagnetospirillum marisnigri TaxID=1285242 RepID=A0A178MA64_9PROT|nr:GxxExxY protein [Paramagnetospirillum marisnigri]OAN45660.1 GxxExxY protein [Paramagnetospirillum marisnigri]
MNTNEHGYGIPPLPPAIEDATSRIIGAAIEVSNVLGSGFLEAVYRRALLKELHLRGLKAEEEVRFVIHYKGDEIGTYVADLVVEDTVIVELKAIESLDRSHTGQVLNYLRASGLLVGMLFNFGKPKLEMKRVRR